MESCRMQKHISYCGSLEVHWVCLLLGTFAMNRRIGKGGWDILESCSVLDHDSVNFQLLLHNL